MTNSVRRETKEANATREAVYKSFDTLEVPEHKFLGRTAEGLVYENKDGLALVVKVIMKNPDFMAEEEIEDFDNKAAEKIAKAKAKEVKVTKAKAKRAEDKEKEEGA